MKTRLRRRWWLLLALLLLAVAAAGFNGWFDTLGDVQVEVRKTFPDVPQLSTKALAEWQADRNRRQPILVDVRASEEFAVSHLAGAVQVDPNTGIPRRLLAFDRETPIVAYCSVGYRSSMLVSLLRDSGFTNVHNLEGSIFAWANEGRPMVRGGEPVAEVHPYDWRWGRLLKRGLRARGFY